jgi:tetratricopeptide (TPR) repeat protein
MSSFRSKIVFAVALGILLLSFGACGGWRESSATNPPPLPAAAALPPDVETTENAIRFLEDRVRRDPDDFIAYNKLAAYYFQRQRETGGLNYLELASRAARASLAAIPAEQNKTGLALLAQAEYASHDFVAARDHALQLSRLDPGKGYPYRILSDALIELGDYNAAAIAIGKMEQLGGGDVNSEPRFAHHALLRGDSGLAMRRFAGALAHALIVEPPSRETVAWCRWQLGETAFSVGDYETAERHYRDALVTFPGYYRALASLGRSLAARGDLAGAIEQYLRALSVIPDPAYVAALGDLYKLSGREKEAAAQYELVEHIARLNKINGMLYNRQLALFYADHDMKAGEAYESAAREYEVRRDIYGADAVAWTALKAGKLAEAQSAIKEALRLGTRDAKLFYHAGMISRAAGDFASARDYLDRALKLNPQFDPMQSVNARHALEMPGSER